MPRGQMKPVKKVKKGTFTRVLKYMLKDYTPHMVLVVVYLSLCILSSAGNAISENTD